MWEVSLNLFLLVLSLLLAVLGAAIGGWLQQRSWREQHWKRLQEEKTKTATQTVEFAARLIDRRLYRQRRLLWAVRRGMRDEISLAKREYQDALFEWMDNLGRIKSELWLSFGQWTAVEFETSIHDPLARIGAQIEIAIRSGIRNSLVSQERELNTLGRTAYVLIHKLLSDISDGNLIGLTGREVVSFENWDNLSISFLLKRLFGIPAQS